MRNYTKTLLLVAVVSLAFFSCKKDRVNGGSIITEERTIDMSFDKLVLDASFDVILVDDVSYDIRIECPERKMEYIKTTVLGSELIIREDFNHVVTNKSKKIYINKNYLTAIEIRKSGDLEGDLVLVPSMDIEIEGSGDLKLNFDATGDVDVLIHGSGDVDLDFITEGDFNVDIDGSGDVKADGEADRLIVAINGSGDVDTKSLEVLDADIFVDGSGDTFVKALNTLHVQLTGSGDIYYLGSPQLDVSDTGSGDVIQY